MTACPSSLMGEPCRKPGGHGGRCASSTGSWERDPTYTTATPPPFAPTPEPEITGQLSLEIP